MLFVFLLTAWFIGPEVDSHWDSRLEQERHVGLFRGLVVLLTVTLDTRCNSVHPSVTTSTRFREDVVVSQPYTIAGSLATVTTGEVVSTQNTILGEVFFGIVERNLDELEQPDYLGKTLELDASNGSELLRLIVLDDFSLTVDDKVQGAI